MANGKPGDHPITDIAIHNLAVFGEPTDTELRQVVRLLGYHRACDWFETIWSRPQHEQRTMIAEKAAATRRDAEERGWELDS